MFDEYQRYVIENYQSQPTFSSFLPGIAGEMGIPLWCYYNNRGQAVCSFGARDKDHAIMEFSPAHVAYRDVSRTGFRTFCKIDGSCLELFTQETNMHIGMGELELRCTQSGLEASALYFGVPGERVAALARMLTLRNTTHDPMELELLDGMPAIVPYGLNQDFLKNMTQLAKAWMQAEDQEDGLSYFRVRASLEDGAIVREVLGGNFCLGWDERGTLLKTIVQPPLVFGEDSSLAVPAAFREIPLKELLGSEQVTSNQFPCCFLPRTAVLAPGESLTLYSLYGQAESKAIVRQLASEVTPAQWFSQKLSEARAMTNSLVSPIHCKTADPVFDAYAKQTYLDNVLRGGAPMFFRDQGQVKPFHIYSRKHGDPEREYNYFSLGSEYYAQGNGNYRDVNQNRRCDVLFAPEVGDSNIHTFFDLIQTDGYNPLVLTPSTYTLPDGAKREFTEQYPELSSLLSGSFTPGQVAMAAESTGMPRQQAAAFTASVVCASDSEPNADFHEGYWCDHWTYNLDLIESYLSVYPEKKQELLFEDSTYRWYETRALVNPRNKRCCMTKNGLRQYYALDEAAKDPIHKWMHTADGCQASSTLMEKLLLLCAIKTATLDGGGMGVEMEGGRPGWYDALNGLPGLLGSSMAESCELARLLDFTVSALEEMPCKLSLYSEISHMLDTVAGILEAESDPFHRWQKMNNYKEDYRAATIHGFSGNRVTRSSYEIIPLLRRMDQAVMHGIEAAKTFHDGLIPTYFTYEASVDEAGHIRALTPTPLPLFLEGPVRYLKLRQSAEEKACLAQKVTDSGLYDRKLKMYKVNESLAGVSYEAGRALAFTPGWLENESVWLHMEYKYLLELLKNGLYTQFSTAFRDAAIPFLDPKVYGRSPLENVSFLASSANPDPQIHGRGFVARLSGSTAEFIHMWQILFFGKQPFRWDGQELTLEFTPYIPQYLMADSLEATFLGCIPVRFAACGHSQLIPGVTPVRSYTLTFHDDHMETVSGSILGHPYAEAIRNGSVRQILVTF